MDGTVYLTGSRLDGLAQNLDIIASNLANANTPGYKRTVGGFQAVLGAVGTGGTRAAWPAAVLPDWMELDTGHTDFQQGPIRRTGRPLDLAIQGDAFFEVETAAGPRYTRKGRLHLNAQGELTDGSGNRFASDSGALRLPEEAEDVAVSLDGTVTAGGEEVGRIRLVEIPDLDALVSEGSCTFRNDGAAAREAVGSRVIQGSVEESNVSPVHEMVALVNVMRAYESNARILHRTDSLTGRLIQTAA